MLIDTHCHLTFPELAEQTPALIERAAERGVDRMITIATTPADAADAARMLESHENVFKAAGIHPHEAGKCTRDDLNALSAMHRDPHERLVAVGETGLDFHYDFAPRDRQDMIP